MKGCQHMSGNTDKAAGVANEAAGKVKQGVGKAVGSENSRAKALFKKPRAMPSSSRATQRTRSRLVRTRQRTLQIGSYNSHGRVGPTRLALRRLEIGRLARLPDRSGPWIDTSILNKSPRMRPPLTTRPHLNLTLGRNARCSEALCLIEIAGAPWIHWCYKVLQPP